MQVPHSHWSNFDLQGKGQERRPTKILGTCTRKETPHGTGCSRGGLTTIPSDCAALVLRPFCIHNHITNSCFVVYCISLPTFNMAPSAVTTQYELEREDKLRDADFNKTLHGQSAEARGGLLAMRNKNAAAQKAALEEYFKHWDNKLAATETEEVRKARRDEYATLTRQYENLCPLHLQTADTFPAITTSLPISTSTVGAHPSISAGSLKARASVRP